MEGIRIGQLAERTGLSIRTLRWYDEIGLLTPSHRSRAGHRLYNQEDIDRLQKILALRELDFSLDEIAECLDDPAVDFYTIVHLQRICVGRDIQKAERIHSRLEQLERHIRDGAEMSFDDMITLIGRIVMHEKYYSEEQREAMAKRREELGEDYLQQVQNEWTRLIQESQHLMEQGVEPTEEPVQTIVTRMNELILEFTAGNPGITESLNRMYKEEGVEAASRGAFSKELADYLARGGMGGRKSGGHPDQQE